MRSRRALSLLAAAGVAAGVLVPTTAMAAPTDLNQLCKEAFVQEGTGLNHGQCVQALAAAAGIDLVCTDPDLRAIAAAFVGFRDNPGQCRKALANLF